MNPNAAFIRAIQNGNPLKQAIGQSTLQIVQKRDRAEKHRQSGKSGKPGRESETLHGKP